MAHSGLCVTEQPQACAGRPSASRPGGSVLELQGKTFKQRVFQSHPLSGLHSWPNATSPGAGPPRPPRWPRACAAGHLH